MIIMNFTVWYVQGPANTALYSWHYRTYTNIKTNQTANFSIFWKSLHTKMFHIKCVNTKWPHTDPSPFIFSLTAKKTFCFSGKYSKTINPFVNTQKFNPNELRWTTWRSGCAKLFFHEFQVLKEFSHSEKNTVCFKRIRNYLSN